MTTTWDVWGDGDDPVLAGVSEGTAKQFVETSERGDLYIQNEDGDEFEYDGHKWVEV
jgi:hypothetical protein